MTKPPRIINPARLAEWGAAYGPHLTANRTAHPGWFAAGPWLATTLEAHFGRMMEAFAAGSYNYGGPTIGATCRTLGIPHRRKAIEAFLTAPPTEDQ